jgi:cellobiose phosphorylase
VEGGTVAAYLKGTDDVHSGRASSYDSVQDAWAPPYEHLRRGLHNTLDRLGPRGLPLIGRAG